MEKIVIRKGGKNVNRRAAALTYFSGSHKVSPGGLAAELLSRNAPSTRAQVPEAGAVSSGHQ